MTGVLKIRGEDRDTHRGEDDMERGRDWGDVSTRPRTGSLSPEAGREAQSRFSLRASGGTYSADF